MSKDKKCIKYTIICTSCKEEINDKFRHIIWYYGKPICNYCKNYKDLKITIKRGENES